MKSKRKVLGATILTIIVALMISVGTLTAQLTQEAVVEQIAVATPTTPVMVPYEPTGGGLGIYPCLIICGVPYVIIVTILAFLGQGMSTALAMVLAGATAAMIACVAICLGGSGGGSSAEDCLCHQAEVTQNNILQ